ncbi:MAG: type II secretion system F family protein [Eubacteriaceae bacterium]|nr:type II secretion system F family protein [Eubacteriaceae bacterium]
MPLYEYSAARLSGKTVRGTKQADNARALRNALGEEELFLIKCNEAAQKNNKPMKAKMLADFCRELGMMIGAGVPLIRALNVMVQRDMNPKAKDSYTRLHQSLQRGHMLSEAMDDQKGTYPDLMVSMIRASESSGGMEQTCSRLATHYEKSYKLKQKVRSAMIYPIILLVITVIVVIAVFLLILPKFFSMFEEMNTDLPAITSFMLGVSKGMQNYWLYIIIGILLVILVVRGLLKTPSVRLKFDRFKLKLPKVGKLMKIICTARFARTLCSCYTGGISMINSLENTKNTVGNKYIESQFDELIMNVKNGEQLSLAIGKIDGFDPKLAASILIGEETGRLDAMLEHTADTFDFESEIALQKLTATVEPLMIVLMAVIIGTIIVSVLLPIPTMYNAVGASGGM